jgi:hypothetical protein
MRRPVRVKQIIARAAFSHCGSGQSVGRLTLPISPFPCLIVNLFSPKEARCQGRAALARRSEPLTASLLRIQSDKQGKGRRLQLGRSRWVAQPCSRLLSPVARPASIRTLHGPTRGLGASWGSASRRGAAILATASGRPRHKPQSPERGGFGEPPGKELGPPCLGSTPALAASPLTPYSFYTLAIDCSWPPRSGS